MSVVLTLWVASVATVLAVSVWQAGQRGLDSWTMYLAGLAGLALAMFIGEGFSWLVTQGHAQATAPGRGAFGAMVGAMLGAGVVLRVRGADFLRYADTAAPAVALGYAVYRLGCFLNGCCFGTETQLPWAVTFGQGSEAFAAQVEAGLISADANRTLPVHPTQIYHAIFAAIVFFVLLREKAKIPGQRFAMALILYGAGRFVLEFFRGDAILVFGMFGANQVAATVMLCAGIVLWKYLPVARSSAMLSHRLVRRESPHPSESTLNE